MDCFIGSETETGGNRSGTGTAIELTASDFLSGNAASVINNALSLYSRVKIPYIEEGIVLDRPILLNSGNRLSVDPATRITLSEEAGGCMIRNKNIRTGREKEMHLTDPDENMLLEGGIWENGGFGISSEDLNLETERCKGAILGVIFFCNAVHFTVRNITVRRCPFYGILIAGAEHFVLENIRFDPQNKDGIHINGPTGYGHIRKISGQAGDDFLALNAWDWDSSAVTFGPIHHILAEDLNCTDDELRLLPGRKRYPDGTLTDCPISDCCFREITGIRCFKLYQQPNCHNKEMKKNDRSDIPGTIERVLFRDIIFSFINKEGFGEIEAKALFEIGSDVKEIRFQKIQVSASEEQMKKNGIRLCEVGPKSSTWTKGDPDPDTWAEIFDPDLICEAEDLLFENVIFAGKKPTDENTVVNAHRLSVNPDYPRTIPKGGTGYGILKNIKIVP